MSWQGAYIVLAESFVAAPPSGLARRLNERIHVEFS
jgi:hypothetical protein